MKIRIGSRGSKLALIQAALVKNELTALNLDLDIEIVPIETTGDKKKSADLTKIGGKALFIKEIQEALLEKTIDIAVHSMKDIPAFIPDCFTIAAVLMREDPRDVFLSHDGTKLLDMPIGSIIGTSSPRRAVQILNYRPDLKTTPFRGNVDSRMEKVLNRKVDATLLAIAGLNRLGAHNINYQILEQDIIIPAVGQGVICSECLTDNHRIIELLQKINHEQTSTLIRAERGFLETIGGTCKTPIGAYSEFTHNNSIQLSCFLANEDWTKSAKRIFIGSVSDAYNIGKNAAHVMIELVK